MNDILICGSSYTSGDGLQDRGLAWPYIFQELTGQSVVNTAVDGGSVDYVCYTVVKEISTCNYKNVIITWPPLGRKLLVRRENNFLINVNAMFGNALYGDSPEFKKFLRLLYKYWSNELYDVKFTLQKILLVQNFLENRKCKYLFVNTNPYNLNHWTTLSSLSGTFKNKLLSAFDQMTDLQIVDEENEIKSYITQLSSNYYNPINFNLTNDCDSKNLIDLETHHPTVDGHKYIADLILQLWNKNDYQ